ncbi:MAG TPA: ABC transporter ATP-binding protein [Acidimicrobiaceae bacterium]|nr:ABC transporter ATP-binding protein [Acidimicrobiaceae bacterium]
MATDTSGTPGAAAAGADEAGIRADPGLGWLRRMGPLLSRHRLLALGSVAAAVVAMVVQVLVPRVVGLGIDEARSAAPSLWPYAVVLAVLGVVRALSTFGYRNGLYSLAFRVEYSLRTLLFEHLGRLPIAFYDRVQTGEIISRANSDIRSIQMFLAFAPIMAVQMLSVVVALTFMLQISLGLTLIALAAMPPVFALGQRLRNIMFPLSWIVSARTAEIATVTDENIAGVRVVKAFAAEQRQVDEMARSARRLAWANLVQHRTRALYTPLIETAPRIALALVLLIGGRQVIDGTLTVGDLVTFNLYIFLLQAPFRFVGFVFIMGQRARASADRIFEVLDEPVTVADRPGAVDLDGAANGAATARRGVDVTFSNVSFRYGGGPLILDGLDLHIPAGTRVAIVGRTGSGKSTLARLLLRFYDVESGRIEVAGQNVVDVTSDSLRRSVGLVAEEPFLFSTSVHDNIAYGRPDATRAEVVAAAVAAQAHDFVSELDQGYETVLGERGYDLSGGQRQRIAIARALVCDPAVIVLDDATSAVDVHREALLFAGLTELLAGRTTIVIAHRLSTISLAERVVLLADGRVAADGTHHELMATEPRYAEVLAAAGRDDGDAAGQDGATAAAADGTAGARW